MTKEKKEIGEQVADFNRRHPTLSAEEQKVKSLWTALQVAEGQLEKRGLPFGQAMYEYREKHSTGGGRPAKNCLGETVSFEGFCDRLNIPRATAYRWIAKYEESIGTRLPKPVLVEEAGAAEAEPATSTSRDVSADEDSELSADDHPLLESESEPTLGSEPEPTPPTSTPTPVVSTEEKDREQLCFLVKRLNSISLALQQVVDGKAKWSKYAEYAEVVSHGVKIADLVKLM
jgi:hypothetical protein